MKNLFIKVVELLKGYFNWLERSYTCTKGKNNPKIIKFKKESVTMYMDYMTYAVHDLGFTPEDFHYHSTPGLLPTFLARLQESKSFLERTPKAQSNIISAVKTYITYTNTVK